MELTKLHAIAFLLRLWGPLSLTETIVAGRLQNIRADMQGLLERVLPSASNRVAIAVRLETLGHKLVQNHFHQWVRRSLELGRLVDARPREGAACVQD